LAYSLDGADEETVLDAGVELPTGTTSHVAAVLDATNDTFSLYLNGTLRASAVFDGELAEIGDVNNWLGRSQFVADAALGGTLFEFRIYRTALTEAQIRASYRAGPNVRFPEP
jgi:hypothetical protein